MGNKIIVRIGIAVVLIIIIAVAARMYSNRQATGTMGAPEAAQGAVPAAPGAQQPAAPAKP